jgi:hypothetical protein
MTFKEQIAVIEQDLQEKLCRRDWHGVMDCAADLRELEAKEKGRLHGIWQCKWQYGKGEKDSTMYE